MIRKAVIPAAGFGTRFLPATKSQPKEMLPIVDTPVIQYVVEEAVASGITDILMVIGKGKRAIEEHFDKSFQLEGELIKKGKKAELKAIRRISELANIHFVWQKELKGLGDAVLCAQDHMNNEPFAVLLGDTVIDANVPATRQLLEAFDRYGESVVLLEEVDLSRINQYGVVRGKQIDSCIYLVEDFVEKPDPDEAPSNLAIASRYVFAPQIFEYLRQTKSGKADEIQLTDAMRLMVRDRAMYGCKLDGRRYDIGNKEGFIKTNVEFALKRDDMSEEIQDYIKKLAKELQ